MVLEAFGAKTQRPLIVVRRTEYHSALKHEIHTSPDMKVIAMIHLKCPKCSEKLVVPDSAVGKRGRCKKCGASINVSRTAQVPELDVLQFLAPDPATDKKTHIHSETPKTPSVPDLCVCVITDSEEQVAFVLGDGCMPSAAICELLMNERVIPWTAAQHVIANQSNGLFDKTSEQMRGFLAFYGMAEAARKGIAFNTTSAKWKYVRVSGTAESPRQIISISSPTEHQKSTQKETKNYSIDPFRSPMHEPDGDVHQSATMPESSASNERYSQSGPPRPEKKARRKSIAEMDEEDYQKRKRGRSGNPAWISKGVASLAAVVTLCLVVFVPAVVVFKLTGTPLTDIPILKWPILIGAVASARSVYVRLAQD